MIIAVAIAFVLAHLREIHLKEQETKLKAISANLEHARNMERDNMTSRQNFEELREGNRVLALNREHQLEFIQAGLERRRIEAIEAPRRQGGNGCVIS